MVRSSDVVNLDVFNDSRNVCSYDECAESNCEAQVNAAILVCPHGLDGLQTLASLRLSQNRRPEAIVAMEQVYSRIVHIREVVHARTVVEEIQGVAEPAEFEG